MNLASILLFLLTVAFIYKIVYNVASFSKIAWRCVRERNRDFHAQIEPFELFLIPLMVGASIWADVNITWWEVLILSVVAMLASYLVWYPIQLVARRRIDAAGSDA